MTGVSLPRRGPVRPPPYALALFLLALATAMRPASAPAQDSTALPALTAPVNDFAGVIDGPSEREIDHLSRALQAATGDTIVVVTTRNVEPFGDIRDYANELFENRGRGIGDKAKDNGLLIVLAVENRRVWIEVGYGLEGIVTDGFSGETSRQVMTPFFRQGDYGGGLLAGVRRLASRIAEARGVRLEELRAPQTVRRVTPAPNLTWVLILIVIIVLVSASGSRSGRGRRAYWGGGPWSGWGGGGFGGGFGGGGGFSGGGFGGFGGGRSGGGGGGASW